MRQLALYAFVISLIWMTFVISLSFIEAPAKFTALGLQQPIQTITPAYQHALQIGHTVFHKLNHIEWICAAFSWLLLFRIRVVRTRGSVILLAAITVLLAYQTLGLYPVLDERTKLIISGTLPPQTWHHQAFVVVESVKVLLLGVLASAQIQSFARAVISA